MRSESLFIVSSRPLLTPPQRLPLTPAPSSHSGTHTPSQQEARVGLCIGMALQGTGQRIAQKEKSWRTFVWWLWLEALRGLLRRTL